MSVITPEQVNTEISRICAELEEVHKDLERATGEYVRYERDYRKAKALAFATLRDQYGSREITVPDREAQANAMTADERYARDAALGRKDVAMEMVRSLRAELNGAQTIGANVRIELQALGLGT